MTRREEPYIVTHYELLAKASYTALQTSSPLDTGGITHGLKGAVMAAAFLVNLGAWTSGSWSGTLQEADLVGGPYTTVDPMSVKWYINGFFQTAPPTIIDATMNNRFMAVSYVAGTKRFIQLQMAPAAAGTLVFGILGALTFLDETQNRAFNNYPLASEFPSITFPTP